MGRVVFVVGAASGIGKQIAARLADAGHRVAVADLDGAAVESVVVELTEVGGDAAAIVVDVTDEASVTDAVATTEERLGPIEVLVHVGGPERARRLLDAVVPGMAERGWGRVIGVVLGPAPEVAGGAAAGVTVTTVSVGPRPRDAEDEALLARLVGARPMGRRGEPVDVGDAVVFLASDAAADLTGRAVVVEEHTHYSV